MDERVTFLEKKLTAVVTEILKGLESLKRKVEEIQADKEAAQGATREKDAQAGNLRTELEELHASMSHCISAAEVERLRTELGVLVKAKEVAAKALDTEKVETSKLRSKIETLENYNGKIGCVIQELNVALEEKEGQHHQEEKKKIQTTKAQQGQEGLGPTNSAQLMIVYGGSVCVYDLVSPEMAQAIMLIVAAAATATKSNATTDVKPPSVPATNAAQAAVPSVHHFDSRWILDSGASRHVSRKKDREETWDWGSA